MEKSTKRETRDFMNVESFSNLPFIRPSPVKEKAIRLFGKEFGGESTANDESEPSGNIAREEAKDNKNGDRGRKFECHYCCRNFPNSQALGGHQNAHKRERENNKRPHLQSAMIHDGPSEAHNVYGVMRYRLSSAPAHVAMAYHHSWSNRSNYSYTSDHSGVWSTSHGSCTQEPINGSPLALWRIPSLHSSTTFIHQLPSSVSKPNSQNQLGYESKQSLQNGHVSLDLHL